jgi:glyoxylase-like metal-dependent hydrolase (beta-lactamase superfamily II)
MFTRIGDVEIWRILESVDPFLTPAKFFPDLGDGAEAVIRAEAPRQLCPHTGHMLLPIQGFLLKTGPHVVLVDACVGHGKTVGFHPPWNGREGTRFLPALAAAGVTPAEVTHVMCTHLHVDHVGWNTRLENGRWVPTFPNARYLFPAADDAHFAPEASSVYTESVLPVIAAGQAELIGPDHRLGDAIGLLATPGHTPGHVSVTIEQGGARALITGDALHSPVQVPRPGLNFAFDADKPRAAASRRLLLEHASERGERVIGSHFPLPSLGRVTTQGDAFCWHDD